MIKILVADDEKNIRKGIITILKRDLKENIEYIEAKNGLEALEITKNEKPSLIITDICMPRCSGLEFIHRLKELNYNSIIIILSGYENFEYAREAIKLGVKEYIMKPIKKEEFLKLMNTYIIHIQNTNVQKNKEVIKSIEIKKILNQVKYDSVIELLNCQDSNEAESCLLKLSKLGITLKPSLFLCAVVQYQVKEDNMDYIDFLVKNVLDECLMNDEKENFFTVQYESGKLVVIFQGKDHNLLLEPKQKLLKKSGQLIPKYCNCKLFIGIGDIVYDYVHLHQSLHNAFVAAEFKIYNNGSILECFSKLNIGPKCEPIEINKLLRVIDQINGIKVVNLFDPLINKPKSLNALVSIKNAYNEYFDFMKNQMALNQCLDSNVELNLNQFVDLWSFTQLKREIKENIEKLQTIINSGYSDMSGKKMLIEILRYIQQNITKDIDLNSISSHFSRTPTYISLLFKKYRRDGFSTYITNERIKIAKKLLEDSTVPIYKVGELSGYTNSKYFSVVFKKVTGESPKSYRDKVFR